LPNASLEVKLSHNSNFRLKPVTINFQIDPLDGEVGLTNSHLPRPLGGRAKRIVDIVVAGIALILASPVMLLITVLIRIIYGAPALFAHPRIGFGGKPFICYKFRTMANNSEQILLKHLASDPKAAEEWSQNRKFRNDPRVTRLGRLLRKSSLDELPQLFNVLRGEMSCVGPRPVVADELPRYGNLVGDYLRARPGLTGAWQVMGRDHIDYPSRVSIDSDYVRNWSIWSDFVILWQTVFAVMRIDRAS